MTGGTGSEMFGQLSGIFIIGPLLFTVTVLFLCSSGKRSRKNIPARAVTNASSTQPVKKSSISDKQSTQSVQSKTKSKGTQSSASLNKSTEKHEKSKKPSKQPTKATTAKPGRSDDSTSMGQSTKLASSRSSQSSKSMSKSKKQPAANESTRSKMKLSVIPLIAAGTSKNAQAKAPAGKLQDSKSTAGVAAGTTFKEQEQSTQEEKDMIEGKGDEKDLILVPKNLRWSGEGGYQSVQLQNTTKERLAIKAKCSDNKLYRVNPVFGFIEPGQKLKVDVVRQKGVPKVDKMVFVSVHASKEELFPKPLFKRSEESQKTVMLPLLVARAL